MENIEIYVYPGMWVNLKSIKDSEVSIETIAHSLSLQCRYTGHCRRMYSVAEHSLYTAEAMGNLYDDLSEVYKSDQEESFPETLSGLTRAQWQLAGLCHDFTEAFIGDVSQPVKETLPEYKLLEHGVEEQLMELFGYPYVRWAHLIDKTLPIVEMDVLVFAPKDRGTDVQMHGYTHESEVMAVCSNLRSKLEKGMTSAEAKEELIRKYEKLWTEITS